MNVRIRVLGTLRVERGGTPVDIGGRRQRAVLARLAAADGHVVAADTLVADLWPEETAPRALAALQVQISHLRRALEPERPPRAPATVLISAAPGYALRLAEDALDSRRATRLIDAAGGRDPAGAERALDEALELWSGPAFAEFVDEPWAAAEVARLGELRLLAVEARSRARVAAGAADRAVPDLERLVGEHPLRESAVGLLALALYRAERQADALAVLAAARRRLADELGVDPGPVLRRLERDVLAHADPDLPGAAARTAPAPPAQDESAAVRPAPPPSTRPPAAPPLVGREDELARLTAAAARLVLSASVPPRGSAPSGARSPHPGGAGSGSAARGPAGHASPGSVAPGSTPHSARRSPAPDDVAPGVDGRVVLVAADPGGGKTALVDAFRSTLAAAGWSTATGRCPEVDGAPPGWAWREIVEQLRAARTVSGDLARRLAPLTTPAGATETFWIAHAVTELVVGLGRPTLIVLDDLHRAEEETLQLLRSVVAGCAAAAAPVLVVATLRPAESGPGLEAALAALTGDVADRITLPGLGDDEVAALLARFGAVGPTADIAALVRERTAGNPLFVRETARMIAVGGDPDAVPDGVRDVLRARLARLPATAGTVLRHAAVLGRDVDVDALLAIVGEPGTTLDALELGVLAGLLTEPDADRVRFTHALVQETLYADVPRLRRTRLHAAAFDALARPGRATDPAVLAHHALAAGSAVAPARALPVTTAAAEAATRFGAYRDAARLWGAAVDLAAAARNGAVDETAQRGTADPDGWHGRDQDIDLRCAVVSALAHAGDTTAAMAARDAVIARAVGTDRLADALTSYDAPTSWSIHDAGEVDRQRLGLLQQELGRTADPTRRTRLLVALVLETESADDALARTASEEAMDLSVGLGPAVRCAALNARGFVVNGPDLRPDLEPVGRELLAVATSAGLAGYRAVGHHLLFMVACGRLELDEAQRHADAAIAIAPGGQLGFTIGWSAIFTAMRALVTGDAERAEAEYLAVQRRLVALGGINADLMGLFGLLAVRHAQGRIGELADLVTPLVGYPSLSDMVAAVLAAAGRRDAARAAWRPDLEPVRTYFWQLMVVLRAEAAMALGDVAVAQRCYAELRPWAGTLAGASSGSTTLGPVDLTLAELAGFLDRPHAERAAHRAGALALARRVGAAYWERRALALDD